MEKNKPMIVLLLTNFSQIEIFCQSVNILAYCYRS